MVTVAIAFKVRNRQHGRGGKGPIWVGKAQNHWREAGTFADALGVLKWGLGNPKSFATSSICTESSWLPMLSSSHQNATTKTTALIKKVHLSYVCACSCTIQSCLKPPPQSQGQRWWVICDIWWLSLFFSVRALLTSSEHWKTEQTNKMPDNPNQLIPSLLQNLQAIT